MQFLAVFHNFLHNLHKEPKSKLRSLAEAVPGPSQVLSEEFNTSDLILEYNTPILLLFFNSGVRFGKNHCHPHQTACLWR